MEHPTPDFANLNPIGLANLNAIFAGFCGGYCQGFTERAILYYADGDMQWAAEIVEQAAKLTPLQVGICAMPETWEEQVETADPWPDYILEMLTPVYDSQLAAGALLRFYDPADPTTPLAD